MIPTVLASARLVASYAAVAPMVPPISGPNVVTPTPAPFTATLAGQKQTDVPRPPVDTKKPTLRYVQSGFFDVGYEKLLGVFSDEIIHGGLRYGQDDITAYIRNGTLDTRGTGLPYPQAVTGTSVGLELRHWFPKNQMFATVSIGDGIAGYNQGKTDVRYGLVGYTNWTNGKWLSDIYGELFYIALAGDTFLDARFRGGTTTTKDKAGNYFWTYVVGQFWVAGQGVSGTENRVEVGPGVAYVWKRFNLSANLEFRGGYSFRGAIPNPIYFNPTFIISAGFD